ncbi:MAG: hypothetical protein RL662_1388 [Bacteroidota bacterium]|jgi:type IX secretion system PorP/SprF family membrane protein
MRIGNLVLIVIASLCFSLHVKAQWDPQISQYWRAKTFFNPSFAAENDTLQASILHRMQWVGVNNAPRTSIMSADMPLHFMERKHGIGIVAMVESVGLFRNMTVGGQYVYKKRVKKNMLNVGVQVGYASIAFDASKINFPDDQKPDLEGLIPDQKTQSAKVDGNIGVSWIAPNYYIGLSSTHLLEPSFDVGDNLTSYIARHYYFTAGYTLTLRNPLYVLQPSVLVKTDASIVQYDVTARVIYNKIFNGGVSWRKGDGFVFLLGLNALGFDAGYAYDLSTSAIAKVSSGTHEFFLRYTIPMVKKKKGRFSHKSIRLL